jgi:hypothetical protein
MRQRVMCYEIQVCVGKCAETFLQCGLYILDFAGIVTYFIQLERPVGSI